MVLYGVALLLAVIASAAANDAKGKWVIYQSEMSYRPRAWTEPPDYTYPFECSSNRDQNKWLPKFASPGVGVAEGRGRLVFHMALLNEDLSAVSKTNEVPLGSMMPIWAAVEQKSHQPLLLLMDECVAMATPDLQPGAQYYPLVGNHGWELLDAGKSDFCSCCDTSCEPRHKREAASDMKLDCAPDVLTLVWTDTRSQSDLSLLRLGSCYPTSVSLREAMFSVEFNDCNFRRQVGPTEWYPPMYNPALLQTYGQGNLVFSLELMNDDFSGPATSTSFPLGSLIPIKATVAQNSHQPLLLLLDECVATPTPELRPEGATHSVISNHGCLMDSKVARSRFEPRLHPSEICLSMQAFSWELLDNASSNRLCDCCDTSCTSRKARTRTNPLLAVMVTARSESPVPKIISERALTLPLTVRRCVRSDGWSGTTRTRASSSWARVFSPGPPSVSRITWKSSTAERHAYSSLPTMKASRRGSTWCWRSWAACSVSTCSRKVKWQWPWLSDDT
ncbi:hypothetical protein CRUP_025963 [Coryphaenoides rupestris]|nr:hypothetical protein CRUP_025963 [Coryphaenoides rupestris]